MYYFVDNPSIHVIYATKNLQGDTIEIGIYNRSTSIGPSIATSAPTPTQGAMIWKDMLKNTMSIKELRHPQSL